MPHIFYNLLISFRLTLQHIFNDVFSEQGRSRKGNRSKKIRPKRLFPFKMAGYHLCHPHYHIDRGTGLSLQKRKSLKFS